MSRASAFVGPSPTRKSNGFSLKLGDGKIDNHANWKGRFKDNSDKMRTGSIYDVVDVLKSLTFLSKSKNLSFREKRMLDRAKFLVISEISEVAHETAIGIEEKVDRALERCFQNRARDRREGQSGQGRRCRPGASSSARRSRAQSRPDARHARLRASPGKRVRGYHRAARGSRRVGRGGGPIGSPVGPFFIAHS